MSAPRSHGEASLHGTKDVNLLSINAQSCKFTFSCGSYGSKTMPVKSCDTCVFSPDSIPSDFFVSADGVSNNLMTRAKSYMWLK